MADTRGRRFLALLLLALPLAACDSATTLTTPTAPAAAGARLAVVTGHVMGPDGVPVAGANILVSDQAYQFTGQADANGRYEIDGVPAGAWTITWSADGMLPVTQTVAIDGDVNLDETLATVPPLLLQRIRGRG